MDRGEYRIESLERRVRHLERRLARLEEGAPAEAGNEAPVETRALALPPVPPPARAPSREPRSVRTAPLTPGRRATGPARPVAAGRPSPAPGWSAPVVPPSSDSSLGAPGPPPSPATPISLKDLEERFAGRALAWVGGIALVAAAIFFLSLAFSRGWITEPMRVAHRADRGHRRVRRRSGPAGPQEPAGGQRPRRRRPGHRVRVAVRGHAPVRPASPRGRSRRRARRRDRRGGRRRPVRRAECCRLRARRRADRAAAHGRVAHAPDAPVRRRHAGGLDGRRRSSARGAGSRPLAFVLAAPQLASWLAGDPDTTQARRRVDRLLARQHRRRGRRGGAHPA